MMHQLLPIGAVTTVSVHCPHPHQVRADTEPTAPRASEMLFHQKDKDFSKRTLLGTILYEIYYKPPTDSTQI